MNGYPPRRAQRLERYLPERPWAQSSTAALRLAQRFDELLWNHGVDGSVAEIGVLAGAFLIGLTQLLPAGAASSLAIDCFDRPDYIPDPAGHGHGRAAMDIFRSNVDRLAYRPQDMIIVEADSILVEDVSLAAPVKLFSVDGLHTETHALHDLQLAARLLAEGGIIIVDDYPNHGCPGVKDAVARFLADGSFVPIAVAENKLFLTRWNYAMSYCPTSNWP